MRQARHAAAARARSERSEARTQRTEWPCGKASAVAERQRESADVEKANVSGFFSSLDQLVGDLMILGMAFPNVLGMYFLSGGVKKDLNAYMTKLKNGEFDSEKVT